MNLPPLQVVAWSHKSPPSQNAIDVVLLFGDANNQTMFSLYTQYQQKNIASNNLKTSRPLGSSLEKADTAIVVTDMVMPKTLRDLIIWRQRIKLAPGAIIVSFGNNSASLLSRLILGRGNFRNYPLTADGINQLRIDSQLIVRTARYAATMPSIHFARTSALRTELTHLKAQIKRTLVGWLTGFSPYRLYLKR